MWEEAFGLEREKGKRKKNQRKYMYDILSTEPIAGCTFIANEIYNRRIAAQKEREKKENIYDILSNEPIAGCTFIANEQIYTCNKRITELNECEIG